jgi:hypothetical protein
MLSVIMLSVIMPNVVGLSVILLSVMLSVIMPSVIGLSVVAPRRLLSKVNIQSVPCFWEGLLVERKICGMQEMFELTFLQ